MPCLVVGHDGWNTGSRLHMERTGSKLQADDWQMYGVHASKACTQQARRTAQFEALYASLRHDLVGHAGLREGIGDYTWEEQIPANGAVRVFLLPVAVLSTGQDCRIDS